MYARMHGLENETLLKNVQNQITDIMEKEIEII